MFDVMQAAEVGGQRDRGDFLAQTRKQLGMVQSLPSFHYRSVSYN